MRLSIFHTLIFGMQSWALHHLFLGRTFLQQNKSLKEDLAGKLAMVKTLTSSQMPSCLVRFLDVRPQRLGSMRLNWLQNSLILKGGIEDLMFWEAIFRKLILILGFPFPQARQVSIYGTFIKKVPSLQILPPVLWREL